MVTPETVCPKCGGNRHLEMGRSSEAPLTSILRCETCGHVWMRDSPARCSVATTSGCSKRVQQH